MTGTDVSLTELLEQTMGAALQRMAGPQYGKINSYNPATERANVTPLVMLLVDGAPVPAPTLPSVPVEWPGSVGHSLKFPIPAGSIVRLAPLGHDHSEWLTSGTPNLVPKSERRFSLADLVATPLVPSVAAESPDPLSYDAAWAVLLGQLAVGGSDAVKAVALNADNCPAVTLMATWMGQVETAINVLEPGSVTPLSPTFNGTAISGVVATATKLKAK